MSKRIVKRVWLAAASAAVIMLVPQSALAGSGGLSSGVHVDPGTPAAKEYAIPLGTARGNGTPTDTAGGTNLFGAGITHVSTTQTPASTTPVEGTTARHTSHKRSHARRHPTRHRSRKRSHGGLAAGTPARPGSPSPQTAIGTNSSSSTGITWMLGAAILVLLLGAAGGALLSRRGRRTDLGPYTS